MKRLKIAAKEYNYQELDRWVKEQFIQGINDNNMLIDISSMLKAKKNTSKVTSNQVQMWARPAEAKRTQNSSQEQVRRK